MRDSISAGQKPVDLVPGRVEEVGGVCRFELEQCDIKLDELGSIEETRESSTQVDVDGRTKEKGNARRFHAFLHFATRMTRVGALDPRQALEVVDDASEQNRSLDVEAERSNRRRSILEEVGRSYVERRDEPGGALDPERGHLR